VRIDIHSHYIPGSAIERLRRGESNDGIVLDRQADGERIVHPRLGMRYPLLPEFFDRQAKLAHMDKLDIDLSILSIVPLWLFHWIDSDEAIDFCRDANDWLSDFVVGTERLAGMATVPLQAPEAAAEELRRAVEKLGLCGVQIGTTVAGEPLDDPRFAPFFSTAEALGVPVAIHPSYSGKPSPFTDFYMKNLVGNPLGTAVAATRLILSGFLDRYPKLDVILAHAGGFMPYQVGRLDHGHRVRAEARAAIEKPPSSYLRRFHYDTITHAPLPLRFLTELVGADRVVLGTDIPFDMGDTDFEDIIQNARLSDEARATIEGGNAARLFRI
jgi:aminocarboxymuconate-semialdehyde decarboxylase